MRWLLAVFVVLLSQSRHAHAQRYTLGGNDPAGMATEQADPRETSYLKLIGGVINGQSISPLNRTITVYSGTVISGQFTVQINSTFSPNAVMAMGMTPTWGSHASSFVALPGFTNPVLDQTRNIDVDLTAPSTAGTYYIITAFNTEYTAAQVMSCTNWTVGNPVWDNGDDVADWTSATIVEANSNGRALVNYLYPPPFRNFPLKVPATAIFVNVIDLGTTTTLGSSTTTTLSSSTTTTLSGSTTTTSSSTTTTSASGSTTTTLLIQGSIRGVLDTPANNAVVSGIISIGGWAAVVSANQAGITSRIELLVDGYLVGQIERGIARPDVQLYLAGQGIAAPGNLGFSGPWDSRTVADGTHQIRIRGADAAGALREAVSDIASISIITSNNVQTTTTVATTSTTIATTSTTTASTTTTTLLQGLLRGVLDTPSNNANVSGDVSFGGWAAIISGTRAGITGRVEFLVDGRLAGQFDRGIARPDVQQYFAAQGISAPDNLGFAGSWDSRTVADGTHQITLRGADAAGAGREAVSEFASIYVITGNNVLTTTTTSTIGVTTTTQPPSTSRTVRTVCGSAPPGGTLTVPVELVSQGDENALGFSLTFDPTILGNPQATWGSDANSALFNTNAGQAAQGRFGVALSLLANAVFTAGVRQVAVVTFTLSPNATATATFIGFGNSPIARQVSNADAQPVPATYQGCSTIPIAHGYEADIIPRPTGKNDGTIAITDWVQICRFATVLDAPAPGTEFQRADCAPRQTLGDGLITITDCVQAGRYAAGLDPATPAGGPTTPAPAPALSGSAYMGTEIEAAGQRVLRAVSATFQRGQMGSLSIELDSQGDENALGFNLNFDPNLLGYESAVLGSGANGAMLMVNSNQVGSGRLGIALALPSGQRFVAGTQQLVTVRFNAAAGRTAATTQVRFGDQPIPRQVSGVAANTLPASYTDGTITFAGESLVTLYFPQVADGGGYRTSLILGNPLDSETTARLDFYADDGTPLSIPMGGMNAATRNVTLSARGVVRVVTDGTSAGIKVGWMKVTCPVAIGGQVIFQVLGDGRILSEAGVSSSPLAAHLMTYIESSGAAATGLAVSNPNDIPVTLTLKLRNVQGSVVATAGLNLPAMGHIAQFVTQWFGSGFAKFEGSLEILASSPVSGVALRYDNATADVFTTLPLIVIP